MLFGEIQIQTIVFNKKSVKEYQKIFATRIDIFQYFFNVITLRLFISASKMTYVFFFFKVTLSKACISFKLMVNFQA